MEHGKLTDEEQKWILSRLVVVCDCSDVVTLRIQFPLTIKERATIEKIRAWYEQATEITENGSRLEHVILADSHIKLIGIWRGYSSNNNEIEFDFICDHYEVLNAKFGNMVNPNLEVGIFTETHTELFDSKTGLPASHRTPAYRMIRRPIGLGRTTVEFRRIYHTVSKNGLSFNI